MNFWMCNGNFWSSMCYWTQGIMSQVNCTMCHSDSVLHLGLEPKDPPGLPNPLLWLHVVLRLYTHKPNEKRYTFVFTLLKRYFKDTSVFIGVTNLALDLHYLYFGAPVFTLGIPYSINSPINFSGTTCGIKYYSNWVRWPFICKMLYID